eukprot:7499020-Alexandrium_andersonii.AAC.1
MGLQLPSCSSHPCALLLLSVLTTARVLASCPQCVISWISQVLTHPPVKPPAYVDAQLAQPVVDQHI